MSTSEDYAALMTAYFHSSRQPCRFASLDWNLAPRSKFLTIGLEGSGHHLVEMMNRSLCGEHYLTAYEQTMERKKRLDSRGYYRVPCFAPHTCGQEEAFSMCGNWRFLGPDAAPIYPNPRIYRSTFSKFVVLVRNPVDAFVSAIRRFYVPNFAEADTLGLEVQMWAEALIELQKQVEELPCDRTLFIAYELLVRFPAHHLPVFARFLSVPQDDANLASFIGSIRKVTDQSVHTWNSCRKLELSSPENSRDILLGRRILSSRQHIPFLNVSGKFCTNDLGCITRIRQLLTEYVCNRADMLSSVSPSCAILQSHARVVSYQSAIVRTPIPSMVAIAVMVCYARPSHRKLV